MKHIFKYLFAHLFIFLYLLATPSLAQNSKDNYKIRLNLVDQTTGDVVGFATVSISLKDHNKPLSYKLSTDKGIVEFGGIASGTYILKAEMLGYKAIIKEIEIASNLDLGDIKLEQDIELLEGAKLTVNANAIEFKKDTIVYNADSFKTSENDMLADLLEKLPGIEIEADGSVTANGEAIKKIMINGEEFFLDDPQLATKNLPAKIIEKVNVIERQSESSRFTGVNDGADETVLDLSLKKGIMGGWFGNAQLGGGHDLPARGAYPSYKDAMSDDWRFQGAGMAGRFSKNSQLSVILSSNNTNNRGFTDFSGSMMKSLKGKSSTPSVWERNKGETTSWMLGVNGNLDFLDDALKLNGNYVFNGSDTYETELSSKETYKSDGTTLLNNIDGNDVDNTMGHRLGFRLTHNFSDNTSLVFQPQFEYGIGNYAGYNEFNTDLRNLEQEVEKKNDGFRNSDGDNENWTLKGNLMLRQRFKKVGRSVSAVLGYYLRENELNGLNQSFTQNYTITGDLGQSKIINQRSDKVANRYSLSGRLTYTEPFVAGLVMEASYSYAWSLAESIRDTYNSASNNTFVDGLGKTRFIYEREGELRDEIYSNNILNKGINQRAGLALRYFKKKVNIQLGADLAPSYIYNKTNAQEYRNNVLNWAPKAGIYFDASDYMSLRVFYYGVANSPNTTHLMPVPNNYNPLNITFGNPNLSPYFKHSLKTKFSYSNKKTFTSFAFYLNGGLTENPIIRARWYNDTGNQYAIYVNGPSSGNANTSIVLNTPIAQSCFSISSTTSASYGESYSFIGTSALSTDDYYDSSTEDFNYVKFNKDFSENEELFLNNSTQNINFSERLRFTFKSDLAHIILGARTRVSKSWYTLEGANEAATWNNKVELNTNWTIPGGLRLVTSLDYNWYNGFTAQIPDEFILNAELTKLLFKKKVNLSLKTYDLLNQAKNISIRNTENFRQEVKSNTLGRYVILSLTYRFGTFGGGKRHK